MTETDSAALAALLHTTIARLERARDESLAVVKPGRGVGPFRSAPSMVPVGRAWRLGALLLDRDGRLFAVGSVTRAVEPKEFGANKSPAAEQRRADQRAAARGPFPRGDTVNFDFRPILVDEIDADSTPVRLAPTGLVVVEGISSPLATYLADRVDLLLDPL